MSASKKILVFGATGRTGKHLTSIALNEGHRVRVLVRNPEKLAIDHPNLEVIQGTVTSMQNLDDVLDGVDFVISMLGDAGRQKREKMNTAFVRELIPAMRRQGVKRFLYQAGGLSRPPGRRLTPLLWVIRNTLARSFVGQHEDNESVMRHLVEGAADLEWMVHRASINPKATSKGQLKRSHRGLSIASFQDCAEYNLRTVMDPSAIHTCDLSVYRKRSR